MSSVDPSVVRRLMFIRLIYQQGISQSQQPEPLSMTSVLSFHDSVELFLVLAAEHLGAQVDQNTKFMDYWQRLAPQSPGTKHGIPNGVNLSGRTAMDRLNRLRNGFKHVGTLPGGHAVEQARHEVEAFFIDNTPLVFGSDVDFAGLDMTDVVTQTEVRDKLQQARASAGRGDYKQALGELAEAFAQLLDDYTRRKRIDHRRSVYDFGSPVGAIESTLPFAEQHLREVLGREFAQHYSRLTQAAYEIQRNMQVIALGLDYRRYARFALVTPEVTRHGQGPWEVYAHDWLPYTSEDYEFCREFVISSALRLVEIDFDLDQDVLYTAWLLNLETESLLVPRRLCCRAAIAVCLRLRSEAGLADWADGLRRGGGGLLAVGLAGAGARSALGPAAECARRGDLARALEGAGHRLSREEAISRGGGGM